MANSNKSRLDAAQCIVGAYDAVEESQRVSIVNSVEYAIELDAEDGDSVISYNETSAQLTLSVNSGGGGSAISTAVAASRFSQCVVYTNVNGNPSATGYVILQASCSDTDDAMWHDISAPIYAGKIPPAESSSPDSTAVTKQGASSTFSVCAKRLRLVVVAAGKPSTGTVVYSLIMRT